MKKVKLEMILTVENEEDVEQLTTLKHHIDYLVDMDSWPEITQISDVKLTELN